MKPQYIQRHYYERAALSYDYMHFNNDADKPHYIALGYISYFIKMLDIGSILDVRCGTGRGVKRFLENNNIKVHGIEHVKAMLDQAMLKNGLTANLFSLGDGAFLPFANRSFDAVCELGVLHHVRDPENFVKEMMRVAQKYLFPI